MVSNGRVVRKDRCLLLFNNMVLCAAMKKRKKRGAKEKSEELESSTGSRWVRIRHSLEEPPMVQDICIIHGRT